MSARECGGLRSFVLLSSGLWTAERTESSAFMFKESRKRNFKKAKRGEARDFQLAPGIYQGLDRACRAYEPFVRATTRGGNLPVTAAA